MNNKIFALLLVFIVFSALTCTALAFAPTLTSKTMSVTSGVQPLAPGGGRGKPDKPPKNGDEDTGPDLSQPNKWAVIIGIADYQGRLNDLWHPDEDAKDMYTVLTSKYGFAEDHITVLLNRQGKAQAIVDAIAWLEAWENETSTVVFFFSGHGYQAPDDWDSDDETDGIDECIVTWDQYGITDGYLAAQFASFESQAVLLWFGSCFSGGMNDLSADGRVITAACQEDQSGYDIYELGNTLFGYYYVDQGMLHDLAGSNGDEPVTVEEAFDYADIKVDAFASSEGLVSDPQMYDNYLADLNL